MRYAIGCDLGTGGIKSALYDRDGNKIAFAFKEYPTFSLPGQRFEQRPDDWWDAFRETVGRILNETGIAPSSLDGVALSGHANVNVLLDGENRLLTERVPIWCDRRAEDQAKAFFQTLNGEDAYQKWYLETGNGDPPAIYAVMKLMWLKENEPETFGRTKVALGSKDYINFRLTGARATDESYASGSGAYSLKERKFVPEFFEAAGLSIDIFPTPVPSHAIVGRVTPEAARLTGLPEGLPVACGGVDNALMALGAIGAREGAAYLSLGSSAWIALCGKIPILDIPPKPFVFAHAEPHMALSGVSIFAAGSAHRWAMSELQKGEGGFTAYEASARAVAPGAGGVLFNPTLAGGSPQNPSEDMRGGFCGLTMETSRLALLRAVLEGVAFDLELSCFSPIKKGLAPGEPLLICGGGAKSELWLSILADVLNWPVRVDNVDQDAAALGAAAVALRGAGAIKDYAWIGRAHEKGRVIYPDKERAQTYQTLKPRYEAFARALAALENI